MLSKTVTVLPQLEVMDERMNGWVEGYTAWQISTERSVGQNFSLAHRTVAVVGFFSRVRILEECSTSHSLPVLFFFFFSGD